ncbi:PqiC family protein [Paraburkholderia tropica]|uniref:PqiC family protein n=1 Tax=Paraburkholderia tropica TaxID=92647 RepID=UPI002ABD946F|nr:PqiC family protein [Paraburkholderia tropica]
MRATARTGCASALIALLACAGCGSPTPDFYAMHGDARMDAAPVAATMCIVVSPVTVPDLVDRPQIVTRTADNRIDLNEFARWAEPLKADIARVIADDLAQRLATARVSVFDACAGALPQWSVRVDIVGIDSVPGDAVMIAAQWAVRPPAKGAIVFGRSLAREPLDSHDYGALVAAHERALGTISSEIAAAIRAGMRQ